MKRTITTITIITLCIVVAAVATATKRTNESALQQTRITRGEYLVTVGGCNDCHTPLKMGPNGPEPDMSRQLSGHPASLEMPAPPALPDGRWMSIGSVTNTSFAGPWGVSFARNLTPDEVSGIGIWTEEMFIRTLRTGKHWGVSRPILPPMPWFNYAKMTDEDLKSVYVYLRSLKPIRNEVPEAILAPAGEKQ